jgi:flagellar motor protein MotB
LTQTARGSVRRWRFASGFCAVVTFTVIVGYYVPLHREAARMRAEREALQLDSANARVALEQSQRELSAAQKQNQELVGATETRKSDLERVSRRIEKLKETLLAQFSRLHQAKLLTVASAADRVSVAVATPALFADRRPIVTTNGLSLLCDLSKSIMAEFGGQIRVTGYYGKARIEEPELAARYRSPWEISAVRAAAAAFAIEKGCGAPKDRFLVVGYGPRAAGPLGENIALEFVFTEGE